MYHLSKDQNDKNDLLINDLEKESTGLVLGLEGDGNVFREK